MGLFKGRKMGTVKSAQGGEYLKNGQHLLMLKRMKESENGQGQGVFVSEFVYLESDNDTIKLGQEAAFVKRVEGAQFPQATLGEIKALMQAAVAAKFDAEGEERPANIAAIDLDDEDCDDLIGEENPCAGVFLKAKVWTKPTKTGGEYTKHSWDVVGDLGHARELAAQIM